MTEDSYLATLLPRAVAAANEPREAMRFSDPATCLRYVKNVLDTNDVVLGAWQEGDGVGLHIIKGRRALKVVIAGGKAESLTLSALPCASLEDAIAFEQTLGDGARQTH